jgi:hypothetical protein
MCCGQSRQSFHRGPSVQPPDPEAGAPAPPNRSRPRSILFQYLGSTALRVRGPASGRNYAFDRPRAILAVDPADRRGLAALPKLKQVGGP